jgi:hypothetical protein
MLLKWTFEKLQIEALKYKTKGEFMKGNRAAHSAAKKRSYYALICSHMPDHMDQSGENNPFFKWTKEELQKRANKYLNRREFEKYDSGAYQAAHKRGYFDELCTHMSPSKTKTYTLEQLIIEADKYSTLCEFRKGSYGAYLTAHKRGLIDTIRKKMPPSPNKAYTLEEILLESRKYNSRNEFAKESPSIYNAVRKKGKNFLDKACSHMKRPSISSPEKAILEEVQKYFPNAKKFRATKLKIPRKSYIKILEVDILIPELKKAIEYDGGWHHSFEGLKRGHPTWKEEDIKSYHEIKDKAFLALGIEIFHIKEQEWKRNKEDCIKRCLIFLGISDLCI